MEDPQEDPLAVHCFSASVCVAGVQCWEIIIITKEYDYGGVMSRGLQGHLTNEIVRRESQRDK